MNAKPTKAQERYLAYLGMTREQIIATGPQRFRNTTVESCIANGWAQRLPTGGVQLATTQDNVELRPGSYVRVLKGRYASQHHTHTIAKIRGTSVAITLSGRRTGSRDDYWLSAGSFELV